jgi:hypothetical protein
VHCAVTNQAEVCEFLGLRQAGRQAGLVERFIEALIVQGLARRQGLTELQPVRLL